MNRHVTHQKLLRWLTPDFLLGLGYNICATRDKTYSKDDQGRKTARKALKMFYELYASVGSEEHRFLMEARVIIVAFANALEHHKRNFAREFLIAEADFIEQQKKIRREHLNEVKLDVLKRTFEWFHIGLWGALGYFIAQFAEPFIPSAVANATGTAVPSVLSALGFAILGGVLRELLFEHMRNSASYRHRWHCAHVRYNYEHNKIKEYHLHRQMLIQLWERYNGEKYTEPPLYESAMEAELRAFRRIDAQVRKLSAPEVSVSAFHAFVNLLRLIGIGSDTKE